VNAELPTKASFVDGNQCGNLLFRHIQNQTGECRMSYSNRTKFRIGMLGAFAVAVASGAVLPVFEAEAQPSGSYQQSCWNIVDDGAGSPTVMATCRKKDGSSKNTSLAYKICESGTVWNDDGNLRCTAKGSFKNSCRNISWNTSFLTAECSKGGWPKKYVWNSGFSYNTCLNASQDIANCTGSLKCGGC